MLYRDNKSLRVRDKGNCIYKMLRLVWKNNDVEVGYGFKERSV